MARRMALDAQPRLDAGAAPPLDGAPSPMKRAFSPAVGSRHQQISPPAKRPQAANPPPPSTVQGRSHRQRQERAKPIRAKGQRAPAAGADLAALDPGARLRDARNAPAEDPYEMRRSVSFGLPASRGGAGRRGPGQPSVKARASSAPRPVSMTKPGNVGGRKPGYGDADRLAAATGLADGQYTSPDEAADAHCKEKDQAKRKQWKDTVTRQMRRIKESRRQHQQNQQRKAVPPPARATTTKAPWATKVAMGG